MLKNYSLIKKGDCYLLRRLTYPRCKLLVDMGENIPEIKNIKFIDHCSVKEMAEVIQDIGAIFESFESDC
jgi:hypothetical protein